MPTVSAPSRLSRRRGPRSSHWLLARPCVPPLSLLLRDSLKAGRASFHPACSEELPQHYRRTSANELEVLRAPNAMMRDATSRADTTDASTPSPRPAAAEGPKQEEKLRLFLLTSKFSSKEKNAATLYWHPSLAPHLALMLSVALTPAASFAPVARPAVRANPTQ